jgi:hypothetical protein
MRELSLDRKHFEALSAQILRRGGALRFRAQGSSMRPFVRDGDLVEVRSIDQRRLRRGDVVLYVDDDGRPFVHRVIEVERKDGRSIASTRGDAMRVNDGPIDAVQILGRVSAAKRGRQRLVLDRGLLRTLGRLWTELSPVALWILAAVTRARAYTFAVRQRARSGESRALEAQ